MPGSDSDPPPVIAQGTTLLDVADAPRAVVPPVPADRDPVATYYCKTLKQVRDVAYDIVIVGGGAVGAAVLDRLMRRKKSAALRVLVFEKGSFLLPEHVQNLHPRYQRLMKDAVARPWRRATGTTFDLAPQIPYLGGRAQFWSTWIPRPSDEQMPEWPASVKVSLKRYWDSADAFLGAVKPSHMGEQFKVFQSELLKQLKAKLSGIGHFPNDIQAHGLEVPLASRATTSSLGYRKFSPVPVLIELAESYPGQVDLVTGCEVLEIRHSAPAAGEAGPVCRATEISTTQGVFRLGPRTDLVLANGIVEPTGLLLDSFADVLPPFAGTNLGGHVASWFSARVPRAAWQGLEGEGLQVACMYLRGRVENGGGQGARDFHIHLMGASNPSPDTAVPDLYRLIPDSFDQEFLQQLSDREHIGFLVHCLGEWRSRPKDVKGSRVYVEKGDTVLDLRPGETDLKLRTTMDQQAQQVVQRILANGLDASEITYWHPGENGMPGAWEAQIPPGRLKDALVHESGTLWLGESPAESVTTTDCRLHQVANVYVGGAATFPTSGSWNPTLAAVAMAQRLADHLLDRRKKG
ncbi:GMC oxidoreductase [Streptomyces diastatochromogenes]|uniref:GMC oxidoreductase n=1 Tax=Streptomyces diastatochromogenes TaxID=42236 RepID=UPI001ABEF02D|nr:GMC oxidoreductase [Streptomyces diastatochromogenes]MCZ0989381.1 GMC oxidoreductase [Streptomyces diastatochromogenes]